MVRAETLLGSLHASPQPPSEPLTKPDYTALDLGIPVAVGNDTPSSAQTAADLLCVHEEIAPNSSKRHDSGIKHAALRITGGLALAGYILFGGASQAEAAASGVAITQAQEQPASGFDWEKILTVGIPSLAIGVGAVTGSISLRNQTKEKKEERFGRARENIGLLNEQSTGEQRANLLAALEDFIGDRKFAPKVYMITVRYFRARREGLATLGEKFSDSEELKIAISKRRSADRQVLGLLLSTLPECRKNLRRQKMTRHIPFLSKSDEFLDNDLQELDELTDTLPDTERRRVYARMIDLSDMKDLQRSNFRDVDLFGAGLKGLKFTNVIFRGARLCEAHLRGTAMLRSDLRDADLRAANLFGATFESCVINEGTKFGNFPDGHSRSNGDGSGPEDVIRHRDRSTAVVKNLRSDTLSQQEIRAWIHEQQRNGLVLLEGSNPEYFLPTDDDLNT